MILGLDRQRLESGTYCVVGPDSAWMILVDNLSIAISEHLKIHRKIVVVNFGRPCERCVVCCARWSSIPHRNGY